MKHRAGLKTLLLGSLVGFPVFAGFLLAGRPSASDTSSDDGRPATAEAQRYFAGEYDGAEDLASKALASADAGVNDGADRRLIPTLRVLAAIAAARGDTARAVSMLNRSLQIGEALIVQARATFTESELASLLEYLRIDEEMAYSLAVQHPTEAAATRLALLFSLLRKGRSIEEVSRSYQVFRSSAENAKGWDQLRESRSRFAELTLLGAPAAEATDAWSNAQAFEKSLTQSTALAQYAQGMLAMNTKPSIAIGLLSASMGTVFVDYVVFRRFDFGAPGRRPRGFGDREYLALIVKNNDTLDVVSLGAAARVNSIVASASRALSNALSNPLPAAKAAYDAIVAPLREKFRYPDIDYVDQYVYVSPEGELSRVPFGALYDGTKYLADVYRLAYAVSGRDASFAAGSPAVPSTSISIFAAPDFSLSVPRGLRARPLQPLPGTREEAAEIQRLFPLAIASTGARATRAAFLSTHAPGVLHVATHGFFLDDPGEAPTGSRPFAVKEVERPSSALSAMQRMPLTRAGLVLAGEDSNGGIVTALDVSGMNLAGTQLVVLSACDTARGAERLGQGVYGLVRAFFAAGAETVVSSLWKIDDATTSALMNAYYGALSRGEARAEALRSAAKTVRANNPHPYYWAAFVAYGTDQSLHGVAGGAIGPPPLRRRGIVTTPMSTEPIIIGPK
jgi:CHAT domain-containing protein